MECLSINVLRKSKYFTEHIRWDVTPKVFLKPAISSGEEPEKKIDITYGYMLYVDLVRERPALLIMQLRQALSQTVGYIENVPEDLLEEAIGCPPSECIAGMYPLTEKLEKWLKKEFGLT